jgi:hypothetical protein
MMHLPNYKDGSIVNLMSSILNAHDVKTTYRPLRKLDIGELKRSTNIVLLVIDGLGYEFLRRHGADTALYRHLCARITSVFPSTTATGITTFVTGLAPAQHAITGWFMLLKEIGSVVRILPFNPRHGGCTLDAAGITPDLFLDHDTVFELISADNYYMAPSFLYESAYTKTSSRGATRICYDSFQDCLNKITEIVASHHNRKYIYAYWPEFDSLCHAFGTESEQPRAHFRELDYAIVKLIDSIKGSNTTLLITSDHGLVDTTIRDCISMKEHPDLAQTLALPLCGEPRIAFCYVRPSKVSRFRKYVTTGLSGYCTLHNSNDLIKKNYFGPDEPNERLFDRIGDYLLIMKEHYVLRDFIIGEHEHFLKANHGGVSSREMYVPLIRIRC